MAVALGAATPALAHGGLTDAAPEARSTLTKAPEAVKLRFSESPELAGTTVSVTGPNGKDVTAGPVEVTVTVVSVPLRELSRAGRYTVSYAVAFDDGDVVADEYWFRLDLPEPAVATETPGTTASPAGPDPTSSAESIDTSPVAAAGAPLDPGSPGTPSWLPAALVAAVAVVAGLAGAVAVRRRRTPAR
jgi:methionine-rich copper-binding protein CopC